MSKRIHFWSFYPGTDTFFIDHDSTMKAIYNCQEVINTTSMIDLSFDLQELYGYDIYIHDTACPEGYLVSYDDRQCDRTNKRLRRAHNVCKMWLAGEFDCGDGLF